MGIVSHNEPRLARALTLKSLNSGLAVIKRADRIDNQE